MWEGIAGLMTGFTHVLAPGRLVLIGVGVILGMAAGVLPGITFVMMVILVLPFTYGMSLENGLTLLAATYVGGVYGGTITSILFNVPGDPDSVPSLWDGYPMAKKGGAGKALAIAAVAGGVGTLFGGLVLSLIGPEVGKLALGLSSPDYLAVVALGLASVITLTQEAAWRTVAALASGVLLGSVGVDEIYGVPRLTFGLGALRDGIDFVIVMTGVYAIAEVLERVAKGFAQEGIGERVSVSWKSVAEGVMESTRCVGTWVRSLAAGTVIGFVPAAGATVAAFVSYGLERMVGKRRELLGSGIAEGLVAPNAAASATVGAALIPLLTVGIPGSAASAVMLAAFTIKGITPGPQLFRQQPEAVYGLMAAIFVAAIVMIGLATLGAGLFARLLRLPENIVLGFVVVNAVVGIYAIRSNFNDVLMGFLFGVLGYVMRVYSFPVSALILGLILGPLAEKYFLTTMISYQNDLSVFVRRPVSAGFLAAAALAVVVGVMRGRRGGGGGVAWRRGRGKEWGES